MEQNNRKAWLYLLPAMAFLGVFLVYPLVDVLVYSFEECQSFHLTTNPTALLLCGEKDQAGDVRTFNRKWTVGEDIPLVWVPGAGHNSNVDNPAFVNDRIERFLAELG